MTKVQKSQMHFAVVIKFVLRWRLKSVDTQEGISFMPAFWYKKFWRSSCIF